MQAIPKVIGLAGVESSIARCLLLIIIGLLGSGAVYTQNWTNPAEKYQDAHKKYRDARCPIPSDEIKHFVYFAKARASIHGHPLLSSTRLSGAQIMYSWKDLEPQKGIYDFSKIEEDLAYLEQHGKRLFIQLQDATFYHPYKAVPNYLLTQEYEGGAVPQYNDQGEPEGWVAKRWSEKVRGRFTLLLEELGSAFDGRIEGINLQETAIGVSAETDSSFSEKAYLEGLKANMRALKKAFPTSTSMIYANFIPGEWLPWEDKGYLRSIYKYGNEIGVGLGAPDLMITRKGQLNHPLAMMHESSYTVPLGIAVQDGNYIGKTGADAHYNEEEKQNETGEQNIVPVLHAFAKDFLKVNYMFWVDQAPYFEQYVLPCFTH